MKGHSLEKRKIVGLHRRKSVELWLKKQKRRKRERESKHTSLDSAGCLVAWQPPFIHLSS